MYESIEALHLADTILMEIERSQLCKAIQALDRDEAVSFQIEDAKSDIFIKILDGTKACVNVRKGK